MSSKKQTVDDLEDDDCLSPKRLAFCREYLVDYNGTQAAIRAGYAENSAQEQSSVLLSKPMVMATIARRMAAAADAAQVSAEMVISELFQLATADSRELMRLEVDCCRHCYGLNGHKYQWTEPEYKRELKAALSASKPAPEFEGGFGFDPRKDPSPDCPACWGRGVEHVTLTPSKKLSKGAAKLLAGMKATKDGVEIKTHDRMAALLALGKVCGIFIDKSELSGPGGGPIALTAVRDLPSMTNEELRAYLLTHGHPVLDQQLTLTEGSTP